MEPRERDPRTSAAPAAFDLDALLAQWRAGFTNIGAEELDELTEHLREEFVRLVALGLSSEEAWLLARHRLGRRESIELEFSKLDDHRQLEAMVSGYLGFSLLLGVLEGVVGTSLLMTLRLGTSTMVYLLAAALAGASGLVLARYMPRMATALAERILRAPGQTLALLLAATAIIPTLGILLQYWIVSLMTPESFSSYLLARKAIHIALILLAYGLVWHSRRSNLRQATVA